MSIHKLSILLALTLTSASAFAGKDPCFDKSKKATPHGLLAEKQRAFVMNEAKKQGLDKLVSSSGVQECDPNSFMIANYPGQKNGGVVLTPLCAPILTFASQADLDKFAATMHFVLSDGVIDSTCAAINFAQPRR